MDQYLQWDSHHHLSANYSVINTLTYRAKTIFNKPEFLQKEMEHLKKALAHCKYPKWALGRVERRFTKPTSAVSNVVNNQGTTGTQPTTQEVKTKGQLVIPCTQGLCKNTKKICSRYAIQTHFKDDSTIKKLCGFPRRQGSHANKRFKEHLKEEPYPVHHPSNNTGHTTTQDNFQIIGREDHGIARTIKESIYIRLNNARLNTTIGKFNLHHMWDRALLNTPGHEMKRHVHDIDHAQTIQ